MNKISFSVLLPTSLGIVALFMTDTAFSWLAPIIISGVLSSIASTNLSCFQAWNVAILSCFHYFWYLSGLFQTRCFLLLALVRHICHVIKAFLPFWFPAFGFDSNWITYCACKFVNIIDNGYCCIEQHDVMKASPWLLLTWLHRASSWLCSPSIFEIWTWSFLRRYVLCETCNFLYGALGRVHRVCWHFFGTYVRPFTHA